MARMPSHSPAAESDSEERVGDAHATRHPSHSRPNSQRPVITRPLLRSSLFQRWHVVAPNPAE